MWDGRGSHAQRGTKFFIRQQRVPQLEMVLLLVSGWTTDRRLFLRSWWVAKVACRTRAPLRWLPMVLRRHSIFSRRLLVKMTLIGVSLGLRGPLCVTARSCVSSQSRHTLKFGSLSQWTIRACWINAITEIQKSFTSPRLAKDA